MKNSEGNGEAKELICTTHGHELRQAGFARGKGSTSSREGKGGKIGTALIA